MNKKNIFAICKVSLAFALCLMAQSARAADFSYNGGYGGHWDIGSNWDQNSVPGSTDTVVAPSVTALRAVIDDDITIGAFSYNSSSSWELYSNDNSTPSTLTILGDLTKAGSGVLRFWEHDKYPGVLNVVVNGDVKITGGQLAISRATAVYDDSTSLNVNGSVSLDDSRLIFLSAGDTTNTFGGILTLDGSSRVYIVGDGHNVVGGSSKTLEVGGLSSSSSSTYLMNNYNTDIDGGYLGTLILNNTSGVNTFAGRIADGYPGADNVLQFVKNGSGTQVFTHDNNNHIGTTTINDGSLLINGIHIATVHDADVTGDYTSYLTANGAGSYIVKNGGTLGGSGSIINNDTTFPGKITVKNDGILQGGAGTTGETLTINGDLTLDDGSVIQIAIADGNINSTLARSGGTWTFDADQSFNFIVDGKGKGHFSNVITGLTGSETGLDSISTWTAQNLNGAQFVYDGAGNVDLIIPAGTVILIE